MKLHNCFMSFFWRLLDYTNVESDEPNAVSAGG